jgi:hypothetical protein
MAHLITFAATLHINRLYRSERRRRLEAAIPLISLPLLSDNLRQQVFSLSRQTDEQDKLIWSSRTFWCGPL